MLHDKTPHRWMELIAQYHCESMCIVSTPVQPCAATAPLCLQSIGRTIVNILHVRNGRRA